jgi:hypothetical protein
MPPNPDLGRGSDAPSKDEMDTIVNDTFDPARFSLEDNQFLIDHLGEPLEVATANGVPPGVTPVAGLQALDDLYRYGRRCEQTGEPFVGFDAIKEACRVFLREHAKMMADHKRGVAPKFPARYEWDSFGQPHLGGVGADTGRVRSYFDEQGQRRYFAIQLVARETVRPKWLERKTTKTAADYRELIEDAEHGTITCPICKFTQNYEPGSRSRRAMARTRLGKHLKTAKKEPDLHRQLYTYVFGS